jgi:hypothetical protein
MKQLSTKRPNIKNHIAIVYSGTIDSKTLEDVCIREILELCGVYDFAMNFTYAIYADHNLIADNMFMPIFHTYYLNSDPKIVVLRDTKAVDLLELYPYHEYYIYKNDDAEKDLSVLKEQFPNHKIKIIDTIKDLI